MRTVTREGPRAAESALLERPLDRRSEDWRHQTRWQHRRPRISVIVSTYNRAEFLEETLVSIFTQTVVVDEVLLVDDGSTDDTENVVSELTGRRGWSRRLRYFRQENQGKSAAINQALTVATGDWIAFNNSDDRWLPEKLALQLTALGEFPDARACFTDARFVNNRAMTETLFEMGLPDRTSPFGIKRNIPALYGFSSPGIYMQTLLVSRDAMRAFGEFDTAYRMGMDTDLSFRLGLITPMCYVNTPLVEVDRTEHRTIGLTTEFPLNGTDRLHVHEQMVIKWLAMTRLAHPAVSRRLKDRLSRTQSALANAYLVKRDFKMARTILRRAVRYNPRLWVLAKFLWSVAAPRSLRREIIRRDARRHA